jgi:hypothetical protein
VARKLDNSPEAIAKDAEAAGLKVQKIRHGWWIWYPQGKPGPGGRDKEWISRNEDIRRDRLNNLAGAKRLGIR